MLYYFIMYESPTKAHAQYLTEAELDIWKFNCDKQQIPYIVAYTKHEDSEHKPNIEDSRTICTEQKSVDITA